MKYKGNWINKESLKLKRKLCSQGGKSFSFIQQKKLNIKKEMSKIFLNIV